MKKNKIIVIHCGGMGDTIHDLAMLKQLVVFCPESQIFYVCRKGNEVLVDLADLGESITKIPIKNNLDLLFLYFKLPFRPNTIVVGCGMNIRKVEWFLRYFFPKRAGASFPDYPQECLRKMQPTGSTFDVLVGPLCGAHRIFVNWEVLRLLEIPGDLTSPSLDKRKLSFINLFDKIVWNLNRPYVVLHHGAASLDSPKRWTESKWAVVADKLIEQLGLDVLLVGGRQEVKSSRVIVDKCIHKDRIMDVTGIFSLSQIVRIIFEAALVIGTDSGPGHIAGAVGTPSVSIFGPTRPSQVAPITEKGYLVYHPVKCGPCYWGYDYERCAHGHTCMEAISEDSVIAAAEMARQNSAQDIITRENGDVIAKCPTVARCRDWPPVIVEKNYLINEEQIK